ncbi:hypothetical protein vBVpaS1601_77 [Vibrio phage vB_VpaS_1601]|uniref:hypothetical protein n=1 Tax=Vibrio phage SHOU24 TaxID=1414739 RepID=UPI0003ED1FA7|nr:hypothetical protein SHOU24_04 [Vibrio phage SHOU24]AHI61201.1 hypothetical protein SHOU24_04 [Vibrio phage SHOU24]WHM52770.1 hypothetical protein vBVpaP1601_77 [Vibrio phage vB_VpaP_1601]
MQDVNKIVAVLRDPSQAKYYHGDLMEDAADALEDLNEKVEELSVKPESLSDFADYVTDASSAIKEHASKEESMPKLDLTVSGILKQLRTSVKEITEVIELLERNRSGYF